MVSGGVSDSLCRLPRAVADDNGQFPRRRHQFPVMGTVFSFAWRQPPSVGTVRAVERELIRIDELFSLHRKDSEMSMLADGRAKTAECSPEIRTVLDLCAQAERLTAGYFSATPSGRLDPTGLVKGWAVRRAAALLRVRRRRVASRPSGGCGQWA
jgi:thiamine biosynthesis lipoprotein